MMILRRGLELNREPREMLLSLFLVFRESHSDFISFTRHRYRFTILELTAVFFEDLTSLSFFIAVIALHVTLDLRRSIV